MKEIKSYLQKGLQKGLVGTLLTGSVIFSGCAKDFDPFHEILRYNDERNMKPIVEPYEVDYNDYDKKHEHIVSGDRAYLKKDVKPKPTLEKIVDVPPSVIYKIPAINATYIEDGNNGIILQYKSRVPAPDLSKLIRNYLGKEIKIDTNENTLIFSGKKEAFNDFKYLTTLLNEFDLPAVQVRVKSKLIEWFYDNTYNRDIKLEILKNKMNVLDLTLPSVIPTPDDEKAGLWTSLKQGIDLNPFYNYNSDKWDIETAVEFLNSYGKTKTLSSADLLTSNGEAAEFSSLSYVPYPEVMERAKGVWVEGIRYRETGTKIKVTPFANEEGFITLKFEKTSGEHTGYYGVLQRPTFREAVFKSSFTVRNGITYLVGTASYTRNKLVKRGIPFFSDIPIVGELFSSREIENSHSMLLYFTEARVIERDSLVGTELKKVEEEVPTLEEIGEVAGIEPNPSKDESENSIPKVLNENLENRKSLKASQKIY